MATLHDMTTTLVSLCDDAAALSLGSWLTDAAEYARLRARAVELRVAGDVDAALRAEGFADRLAVRMEALQRPRGSQV